MKQNENEKTKIIPLCKWEEHYQYPTYGAMRKLVFNAKKNGIGIAVRRIGGRVYIKVDDFFSWIESIQEREA